MNGRFLLKQVVVWLAVAGVCIPQLAFAATPTNKAPAIVDLTLHEGDTLVGQVVNSQGTPLAKLPISLRGVAGELSAGQTNATGHFAFKGLSSGVYELAIPAGSAMYRVWSPAIAPPAAQPAALMVAGEDTVRGQGSCDPCSGCIGFLGKHPLLTAGLIAAAIAIPIAVTADKGPSTP